MPRLVTEARIGTEARESDRERYVDIDPISAFRSNGCHGWREFQFRCESVRTITRGSM